MAVTTPIAQYTVAFDGTVAHDLSFVSSGGNQVVKNRLTVRNNTTNDIVYQNTLETFVFKQSVPPNTLTNGVYYNFYFNTYDVDDNESADSNTVAFYCYSAPTILLTNAPSDNIIKSTSYDFIATYDQIEGELLDYLIYYLYDSNGNELSNSSRLYSTQLPPTTFNHLFSGFVDNGLYKIQVKAVSVNGTLSQSELYEFSASFIIPNVYSLCELENNAEDGYITIKSNVVITTGVVEPSPAKFRSTITDGNDANYIEWDEWYTPLADDVISQYAEWYELDLTDVSQKLIWSSGFLVPQDFQMVIHMDYTNDGDFIELFNSTNVSNKIYLEKHRGIPSGESVYKTWVTMRTTDGALFMVSNYVDLVNENARMLVFMNKIGNVYTLTLQTLEQNIANSIEINGASNVEYGMMTDIGYVGENIQVAPYVIKTESISSIFPIDTVIMYNGVYDNLDISSDTSRPFSIDFPVWDYYTELNCDFSSLNGGNLNITLAQLESVKIKRRISSGFNWITLENITVENVDDLKITRRDNLVPTGETFEYAIIPVMSGGVEGEYLISSIDTCFRWCYLCDKDTTIKFYSNCSYPSITTNPSGGLFAPIGRPKPITIFNSISKYDSGTFSGDVLGSTFLDTRKINRKDIQTTLNSYKLFMTNNLPKMLKDWDGRIKIVSLNIENGLNEGVSLISGISNVNFSWVQIGDYDIQQDLYDNGFTEEMI